MKKIDGHVHACGMIIDSDGAMEYLRKNDLEKIVLSAGEPDSSKIYKLPYLAKIFKTSRLIYFNNALTRFLMGLTKMYHHIDQGNEKVALMAKEHPECILNTYWINPTETEALQKMETFYQKYSFCMIKMHQCWTDFDLDDGRIIEILKWAQTHDTPVFLHLRSKDQVRKLIILSKEYREVNFILGHLIGIEEFDHTIGENVYFDISCAPLHSIAMLRRAYDNFGANRILLGSDAPYGTDNIELAINQMRAVGMNEQEVQRVCYQNIRKLLELE